MHLHPEKHKHASLTSTAPLKSRGISLQIRFGLLYNFNNFSHFVLSHQQKTVLAAVSHMWDSCLGLWAVGLQRNFLLSSYD